MQVQKFSTLPYTRPDYAAAQQKLRELPEQAEHTADYAALKAVVKERNVLTAIGQPAYLLPKNNAPKKSKKCAAKPCRRAFSHLFTPANL